ncbi:hypothetical protein KP509_1Z199100 [Ceratopteris richardii]|nr:hypothetical protein KP509_1Z199100 [Ceratopteris richardii]
MKPIHAGILLITATSSLLIFYFWLGTDYTVSWSNAYTSIFALRSKDKNERNSTHDNIYTPNDGYKQDLSSSEGIDLLFKRPIWERPSPNSRMPPIEAFGLTRQMVASRAKKNVIVVTFANHAFLDFVLTWVKHLTDLNVFNLIVGAMDTQILEALFWEGVPVFNMGSNVNTIDVGWGSPTFHKMGREKVILVDHILSLGFEILMCDTDMVWTKNPLPYLARFPTADVLVSSDQLVNSVDDDQLENWERAPGAYNIGIFLWRPTLIAKHFAKEWKTQLLKDDLIWDQNGFNDLMRKQSGPSVPNENGIFYAYNGSLKLGILPVSIFCSGHTFFVQALYEKLSLRPYAVHTTFQFGGTPGKRHRLREAKLFHDKPEYYNVSNSFLSYRSSIPDELLTGGPHSIENHFKLVNYQIKQVRDALAIASILNRTLVMPKLYCRLDRLWFGHPGVIPGTKTDQPFLCPMDHIFEVDDFLFLLLHKWIQCKLSLKYVLRVWFW